MVAGKPAEILADSVPPYKGATLMDACVDRLIIANNLACIVDAESTAGFPPGSEGDAKILSSLPGFPKRRMIRLVGAFCREGCGHPGGMAELVDVITGADTMAVGERASAICRSQYPQGSRLPQEAVHEFPELRAIQIDSTDTHHMTVVADGGGFAVAAARVRAQIRH